MKGEPSAVRAFRNHPESPWIVHIPAAFSETFRAYAREIQLPIINKGITCDVSKAELAAGLERSDVLEILAFFFEGIAEVTVTES